MRVVGALVRDAGLQGQRVQLAAHAAVQRVIDHLVLLNAGLALEAPETDMGRVMVAVAAQILDRDLGVGDAPP